MYSGGTSDDQAPARLAPLGAAGNPGSMLLEMLLSDQIVPGSEPGYQLCKILYSYHTLGAVLAEAPITLVQQRPRDISMQVPGDKRIIQQFNSTWDSLNATQVLHNLFTLSRIYGISSLVAGERGKEFNTTLDFDKITRETIFFSAMDPLNTAGSLVLNQDPLSPDFLKPREIRVASKVVHPSRTVVKMNEMPIYIDWTNSAFGFVGRSVYQRALYPMKTFIQSEITDQFITLKAGLLVAKLESPGSVINNLMKSFAGQKRAKVKAGVTGQVLQIGLLESIETLNMQNLDGPAKMARDDAIKNIASATGMPASIIAQETLTEGFGEGTEDAKKEVRYLNHIRKELQPGYTFMDRIVQRLAWTEDFYKTLWGEFPEFQKMPYETWLSETIRAFRADWPNLLEEPDSEKSKTADVQMKATVAFAETIIEFLDPHNKMQLIDWMAQNANERPELFTAKLDLDMDALEAFLVEKREHDEMVDQPGFGEEPGKPRPFSAAS